MKLIGCQLAMFAALLYVQGISSQEPPEYISRHDIYIHRYEPVPASSLWTRPFSVAYSAVLWYQKIHLPVGKNITICGSELRCFYHTEEELKNTSFTKYYSSSVLKGRLTISYTAEEPIPTDWNITVFLLASSAHFLRNTGFFAFPTKNNHVYEFPTYVTRRLTVEDYPCIRVSLSHIAARACCEAIKFKKDATHIGEWDGLSENATFVFSYSTFEIKYYSLTETHAYGLILEYYGVHCPVPPDNRPDPRIVGEVEAITYPLSGRYENNARERWMLSVDSSHFIKFNIAYLRTEQNYDHLSVFPLDLPPLQFSGVVAEYTQVFETYSIEIEFTSDSSVTDYGFHVRWHGVINSTAITTPQPAPTMTGPTSAEGGIHPTGTPTIPTTAKEGDIIASPNFPLPYPNDVQQTTQVYGHPGGLICLNVTTLSLESCCDFLEVFLEKSRQGARIVAVDKYCYPTTHLTVIFTSDETNDETNPGTGFSLLVSTPRIPDIPRLPVILTGEGTISLPNYLHGEVHGWVISSESVGIAITFDWFSLEMDRDFLRVLDWHTREHLDNFTGALSSGHREVYHHSEILLLFTSDESISDRGFECHYSPASSPTASPVNKEMEDWIIPTAAGGGVAVLAAIIITVIVSRYRKQRRYAHPQSANVCDPSNTAPQPVPHSAQQAATFGIVLSNSQTASDMGADVAKFHQDEKPPSYLIALRESTAIQLATGAQPTAGVPGRCPIPCPRRNRDPPGDPTQAPKGPTLTGSPSTATAITPNTETNGHYGDRTKYATPEPAFNVVSPDDVASADYSELIASGERQDTNDYEHLRFPKGADRKGTYNSAYEGPSP